MRYTHILITFLLLMVSNSALALKPIDPLKCQKELTGALKKTCLSALKNNPDAMHKMGRYYAGHIDSSKADYRQAFFWHRRLARLAIKQLLPDDLYAETMYNTGVFYADGLGTLQNHKKAFYWFEKAALRGEAIAMLRLAIIYSDGLGVAADIDISLGWLYKAVNAGNIDAKVLLAQVYSEGKVVKQDNIKALELLRDAAEQNSPNATFALAKFYLHGVGVEANPAIAKGLFSNACRLSFYEACKSYHDLDTQQEPQVTLSENSLETQGAAPKIEQAEVKHSEALSPEMRNPEQAQTTALPPAPKPLN